MFFVWQQPLVAVVSYTVAKEEVSGHKEHQSIHKAEGGMDCGSTSTVQDG